MAKSFTLPSQAITGFSNAAHYDQYRPSYPAQAVEKLLIHLGVANQKNGHIIDLASGTGKFTELLTTRPEQYEVVAIEPHEGMRGALVQKNLGSSVKVLDGHAGSIPVEDGWGDALVAAQAFHWFATKESLKEIHRVLRPQAAFGMIWNIEDYNGPQEWETTTKWEQKLKDIFAGLEDGYPRFRHMQWREVFEQQLDTTPLQTLKDTFNQDLPLFSLPLGTEDIKWTVYLTDDELWLRYSTLSQIANQEDGKKEEIRRTVFEALQDKSTERNENGEVAVNGVTHLVWTSRV